MVSLHNHVQSILRIAWSHRLPLFLDRQFHVVPVPAAQGDIRLEFSTEEVLHIAFPAVEERQDIHTTLYNKILDELRARAAKEGIEMGTGTESAPGLSLTEINIHAESSLLVYHLQHPEIRPYRYFGGSKLSCHGCGLLFSSFNAVADSFHLSQHFTRGSHGKIYLRWPFPFPSLPPALPQVESQADPMSLDIAVRKGMVEILGHELTAYIRELLGAPGGSTPPRSDSTAASGDSNMEAQCLNEEIDALLASGMCESKLPYFVY